jgi:hypothetical protein
MTTPALAQPQPPAPAAASTLEQWFDAELRPVLLERLAAADGGVANRADTRHKQTIAAIEHWLASYPSQYGTWTPETQQAVTALKSEVRGLLDGIGGF